MDYKSMALSELLNAVDRSNPEVRELAFRLETETRAHLEFMNSLTGELNRMTDEVKIALPTTQDTKDAGTHILTACPKCFSINTECVSSNPDGRVMNTAYDCKDCGHKWEQDF